MFTDMQVRLKFVSTAHHQNSAAERAVRDLYKNARILMYNMVFDPDVDLSESAILRLWNYAIRHACLLHNIDIKTKGGTSAYQKVFRKPFDYSRRLPSFGSRLFFRAEDQERRSKMHSAMKLGYYLGESLDGTGAWVLSSETGQPRLSHTWYPMERVIFASQEAPLLGVVMLCYVELGEFLVTSAALIRNLS